MITYNEANKLHKKLKGKIRLESKVDVSNNKALSIAYTPGVAGPCLKIKKNIYNSYKYTNRANQIAIITDGSAVLGLGNIGAEASMPVMEGKSVLFKTFANIDAFPISIKSQNVDKIVETVKLISSNFAGINLEDISAPRCFEIEERLKKELDIPIFHDDQHGTAIVVAAALINALKVVNKNIEEIKIIINGAGAAGIAICRHLLDLNAKNIILVDRYGAINENDSHFNEYQKEMAKITNPNKEYGSLKDVIKNADVFIGVSVKNVLKENMIKQMANDPIFFALANPIPEIEYEKAKKAGAKVVGTGSSKYPNQINNVLAFPGVFKGTLKVLAKTINSKMKIAATYAIANCVSKKQLSENYIIPYSFNKRVHNKVANAVKEACLKSKEF